MQLRIRSAMYFMLSALVFLGISLPVYAQPRVGVATMEPGTIFFERFGHNAVIVQDADAGTTISYNFGFFNLEDEGFIVRFIQGDMRYQLVALPFEQDLIYYQEQGRGVYVQWLDLSADEALHISNALQENARPENATYRYDYFTDNCSTRVRDAINSALHGELKNEFSKIKVPYTYRSESVRLASPSWWMWLGFDIGLGPLSDQPMTLWEDAFVPMRLAAGLAQLRQQTFVTDTQNILPHTAPPEPQDFYFHWWKWLLAGLTLMILLLLSARYVHRFTATLAILFWCVCGVLGSLMLFIWFGTEHQFGWRNYNLALFNPLCVVAAIGGIRYLIHKHVSNWMAYRLYAIVALAMLTLIVLSATGFPQKNLHWFCLLLPIHFALCIAFTHPQFITRASVP